MSCILIILSSLFLYQPYNQCNLVPKILLLSVFQHFKPSFGYCFLKVLCNIPPKLLYCFILHTVSLDGNIEVCITYNILHSTDGDNIIIKQLASHSQSSFSKWDILMDHTSPFPHFNV